MTKRQLLGLLAALWLLLTVSPAAAQLFPIPPATPPGGLEEGSTAVPPTLRPSTEPPPPVKAPAEPPTPGASGRPAQSVRPPPFGANLFVGNFLKIREDGLNPDYVILPGDHVTVYAWGGVQIDKVFVVDGQGNIFIPEVGPIKLAGVKNAELTTTVQKGMARVYARNVNVYTNLITAKPVAVFVTGGVARPGRYGGIPSDSVLFFLDQAGGIDPNLGSYRSISVLREGKPLLEVDLYRFMLEGKLPQVQFQDGDTILVKRPGPTVELRGDVAKPAMLEFHPGTVRGADVLAVIPGAARATQVTLEGIRSGSQVSHTVALTDFSKLEVRHGDSIDLRVDGMTDTILVRFEGQFRGPSVLSVRRGARLIDVLNYVPVDPVLGDVRSVHIRRESVAQAQKRSIDDALFRLERSSLLALSQSNGESNIRVKEADLTLKFVERARLLQPLGRVVTSRGGAQYNVTLEHNDVIVIPQRTNVVRVSGEVMVAQAVMYRPGLRARDFVIDAGGYSDRADQTKIIVIHPNAQVVVGDGNIRVGPGDEVLVPPRIDSKTLQNFADVTQVIFQIAVSTAVVLLVL
ncbi:MAG: polysaccharide biosynthesis/export family protein [Polyangiaceae bacterium]|nr:polysaccharide biosynthesis/export family protein [Polyangiaceae bacterium]